jgi:signal transduction histidine kinase
VIAQVPWIDRLAHDLRGPLTPLQTAAYLLRSGQVTPERQQELFALIDRQTRQLVRMIDELGDWTRASQQRLVGTPEGCDPALLLDYARTNSGAAGAEAIVENHADDVLLEGDPVRLTQLLRILIEYASAHGRAPATVVLRVVDARLRIDVSSAGAPPDAEELAALFEQPHPAAHDEGLGLQLLIAHAIAEGHHGSLQAIAEGGRLRLRCELPLPGNP